MLGRGVHPKIVQEMLGYSTITQTMDTYSHVLPDMQDEAVSAMESALSK
jgi:integrase